MTTNSVTLALSTSLASVSIATAVLPDGDASVRSLLFLTRLAPLVAHVCLLLSPLVDQVLPTHRAPCLARSGLVPERTDTPRFACHRVHAPSGAVMRLTCVPIKHLPRSVDLFVREGDPAVALVYLASSLAAAAIGLSLAAL
jgi:hypothetical protein